MSLDNLKAFLALAAQDDGVARELQRQETPEAVVVLGAIHGFEFTVGDIKTFGESELSDTALDSVAGGYNVLESISGGGPHGDVMASLFYVFRNSIEEGTDRRPLLVKLPTSPARRRD